jgi:hypothetical protein
MLCSHQGNTSIGKNTPPKSSDVLMNIILMGSPLLKIIIKLAANMPRLLKLNIVSMRMINAPNRLAFVMFTPRRMPTKRYSRTLMEAKMKLQSDEKVITVAVSVGVTSMASKVPIICSSRMVSEKPRSETIRYVEKAMPISTKEK